MSQGTDIVTLQDYKKNLKRIFAESVLTSIGAGFSTGVITIFWNSVGMDQTDIGFVQMIFTLVICCLDIPMGYVADRFNKRVLNIIGDFGSAIAFFVYAFSKDIKFVLFSEILLGVSGAMTNGVDQSFLKHTCDKIDSTGNLFKKANIDFHTARYIMLFLVSLIGGFIAKYSIRLTIWLSFIPLFIGAIIALKIFDDSEKVEKVSSNPFKNFYYALKEVIKSKKTRGYLLANIIGKELTHAQIWVLTPLLLLVGVPIEFVSVGWVLKYVMEILGVKLSKKLIRYNPSKQFIIPVVIEFLWIITILLKLNIVTVWLFSLNGFVHGLLSANMVTSLQESVDNKIHSSAISIASTGGRILYIPLVYFVNYLGNIKLILALLGVLIVFVPLCIFTYVELKKFEND